MAKKNSPKERILILDDEPQYLEWLVEYMNSKGYEIDFVTNLADSIEKLNGAQYRFFIADLGVPVSENLKTSVDNEGTVYSKYPGLYAAHHARNLAYRSRQVVVYSVHDSDLVREVAGRIGVCYITKGRPKMLKQELDDILSYDPTKDLRK